MEDFVASYRVVVTPHSKLKAIQQITFICWYCLAVYFWPYFIPSFIKVLLITLSLLCFILYLFWFNKKTSNLGNNETFYLSELGQLEWVATAKSGQLLPSSYFWPFCFYLKVTNPISRVTFWKVIFSDQINDDSARRLRRIIKRLKGQ